MRTKPLLIWIALGAMLTLSANGLLALHLWGCHSHVSDSCDSCPADHSDPHDSQHCRICQVLLGHLGKYIADTSVPMEWTGSVENRPVPPGEKIYAQPHRSARIPRAPPA